MMENQRRKPLKHLPSQKGYTMQRHSTVSEFCSRRKELRDNSSSARSCVRELRENSSSARSCVFQRSPNAPQRLSESFSKKKLFFTLNYGQINDPSLSNTWPLKSYTIQSHSTVNEFCSRLGELREDSSSARSCFFQGKPPERPPNECPPERPPSPKKYSTASEFRSSCGY